MKKCPFRQEVTRKSKGLRHTKVMCSLVEGGYCLSETEKCVRRDYALAQKVEGLGKRKRRPKATVSAEQGKLI